jgi:methyl-accepting chemotaxis protein
MGLTLGPMQGLSMSNPVLAGPLTPSILNVILKHVYRIMKDLLRVLPLKLKLLVTVGLALGIFAILLVMNLVSNLNSMKGDLVEQSEQAMEAEIIGRLQSEAGQLGSTVGGYLNSVFRVPLGVAKTLVHSIDHPEQALSRDQVNQLVSSTLDQHQDISSMYAQFEPNGYDTLDASILESGEAAIHTVDNTGSLEIYWIRNQSGQLEQQKVEDATEKWNAEVGEFGIREAEWYLCAKDKGAPCMMEPYLYEISEGYEELMTSLGVPVMAGGQFRGLVGVDINLPIFQTMIDKLHKNLYEGQSRITLLSEKGLVVGSSQYKEKLTRPLTESVSSLSQDILSLHEQKQKYVQKEGTYYVASPIYIDAADIHWSLLIELPEEVVAAGVTRLTNTIDSRVVSIVSSEVITAIVITVAVLFALVLLVRSIVQPIKTLDDMVQNLASHDGDLTRDVRLNTHAELISLSKGFNRFIHKLRDMVNELKSVGDQARDASRQAKTINEQSVNATKNQQREIDSVVTATNEMSATANEVSQLAVSVAENVNRARETVMTSQSSLSGSVNTVQGLTADMQRANESISDVASRTEDINQILDVIRTIAEQTNLLALNAAIEAARAGEQGRGFAVVADEVRSLASKTQSSTDEINTLIQSLQGGVKQAVAVIESSSEKAKGAMEETQSSYESLSSVVSDIGNVAEHITQVATAAEEQSAVSEEISKNLTIIGDAASELASLSGQSDDVSEALEGHMQNLDKQLASLRT